MHRTKLFGLVLAASALIVSSAAAQRPLLDVDVVGATADGDREWVVSITPQNSGAMAVELAFSLTNSFFLNIDVNEAAWYTPNPGNNPFTGTITNGLWLGTGPDELFAAFGSMILSGGSPVELFRLRTLGLGTTTLNWGELASPDPTKGDIIATSAGTFTDYSGSLTANPPARGTVVYDSLSGGTTGGLACCLYPVGQTVDLAGSDHRITQFETRFDASPESTFVLEFYELSPTNGKPDRLIWQSPIQEYPFNAPRNNRELVRVDVPGIEVPDIFAWMIRSIQPGNNVLFSSNPPVVGAGYHWWLFNPLLNDWVSTLDGHFAARIRAVPEPHSSFMLLSAGIIAFRRKPRATE
jgi:hypothetical protein